MNTFAQTNKIPASDKPKKVVHNPFSVHVTSYNTLNFITESFSSWKTSLVQNIFYWFTSDNTLNCVIDTENTRYCFLNVTNTNIVAYIEEMQFLL